MDTHHENCNNWGPIDVNHKEEKKKKEWNNWSQKGEK